MQRFWHVPMCLTNYYEYKASWPAVIFFANLLSHCVSYKFFQNLLSKIMPSGQVSECIFRFLSQLPLNNSPINLGYFQSNELGEVQVVHQPVLSSDLPLFHKFYFKSYVRCYKRGLRFWPIWKGQNRILTRLSGHDVGELILRDLWGATYFLIQKLRSPN